MPYKDITYDNGFTERVYFKMTASEEAGRFKRTIRVKSFPSANHRAATNLSSISKGRKTHLRYMI